MLQEAGEISPPAGTVIERRFATIDLPGEFRYRIVEWNRLRNLTDKDCRSREEEHQKSDDTFHADNFTPLCTGSGIAIKGT
jgi:hypothetical protein